MAFRYQSSHIESEQEESNFGGSMGGMNCYNRQQGGFGGGLGGGSQLSGYTSYSSKDSGMGMGGNQLMRMGGGMGMGYNYNNYSGSGYGSNYGTREEISFYASNNGSFGYNPCQRVVFYNQV